MLDHNSWLKVADLLRVQQYSKTYNENGDRRTVFYAESGILVHYIYDNALLPKVAAYFDLVRNQHAVCGRCGPAGFWNERRATRQGVAQLREQRSFQGLQTRGSRKGSTVRDTASAPLDALNAQAILADVHLHSPDYQKSAKEEFEAVLKIDPNNASALRGLGYSYLMKQDLAKAADYLPQIRPARPQ